MAKIEMLIEEIKKKQSAVIAFSGGVDSTFLAYCAKLALGDKAIAITIDAPQVPRWELSEATELTASWGMSHKVICVALPPSVENNPEDRCYHCKREIFGVLQETARAMNVNVLMDGSNYDDLSDYRPGLRALKELEVWSPLMQFGWTKSEIREASAYFKLPTSDKPAYACLLTRIPANTVITHELLKQIERAETVLFEEGFSGSRVRVHGDLARIEIQPSQYEKLMPLDLRARISQRFKACGFRYVTFDILGYQMGSLNPSLEKG